jgi:hypothetical protein
VFYRRSTAFLHFHEDPAGFFADAKIGPGWIRFDVTTAALRRALVKAVSDELSTPTRRKAIAVLTQEDPL